MNSRRNFISLVSFLGVSTLLLKGNTYQKIISNNEKILPKVLKKATKLLLPHQQVQFGM